MLRVVRHPTAANFQTQSREQTNVESLMRVMNSKRFQPLLLLDRHRRPCLSHLHPHQYLPRACFDIRSIALSLILFDFFSIRLRPKPRATSRVMLALSALEDMERGLFVFCATLSIVCLSVLSSL